MTSSSRSIFKEVLFGFSWVMVVIAALSFLIGGKALQEFAHIDRLFAEIIGIAIAFLCGALGFIAKNFADDLVDPDLTGSENSPSK
jgi:hypothetical protein